MKRETSEKILKKLAPHYVHPEEKTREILLQMEKSDEISVGSFILDAGCGIESILRFIEVPALKIGLDIHHSPPPSCIDFFVRASACSIPFKDESFNLIYSFGLLEHLENPRTAIEEFSRILNKNGLLVLGTSNLLNYGILIAKMTPLSFHHFIRKLALGKGFDNDPTYYRGNTPSKLKKILEEHGINVLIMETAGWAFDYLRFSKILYALGILGDRITDFKHLRKLKSWIIVAGRKEA